MLEFWNERYGSAEFAYGEAPNLYFKQELLKLKPGKLLLPAEGEGRNAVFAAKKGWEVTAFDMSSAGKAKAEALAEQHSVNLEYKVGEFSSLAFPENHFDAIGLIYSHFPPHLKTAYNQKIGTFLKPGGIIILEVFSKNHLKFSANNPKAGGPRNPDILYSTDEIIQTFPDFDVIELTETEVELSEGLFHVGMSSVIRFVGRKK